MSPLQPASETWVDPESDRCDAKTARAPPNDCPSRCMFPGSVCATSLQSDGRVPQCYSWLPRRGHREMSTMMRLPAANAEQMSRPCPRGDCACAGECQNAHTTPATVPRLGAQYPYDTAVAAQRVRAVQSEQYRR